MNDLLLNFGLFAISLALLIKSSNWFIEAAERIGLSLGVSPFIIGVTVVAVGTSLPELSTSIISVYQGQSVIVVGNVVGSNITNILLVMGSVALFSKRTVRTHIRPLDVDLPLLVASAVLLWFVLQDLRVSLFEAILLMLGLGIFLGNSFEGQSKGDEIRPRATGRDWLLLLGGAAGVYFGAEYTIKAISAISLAAGLSSEVVALTLVALGTSLPELVVSVSAARQGKSDIAIGNVLGSNIFNIYGVMGIPALLGDLDIPAGVKDFSLPLMMAATLLFMLMILTDRISRWEGIALISLYAYFVASLF